MSKPFFQKPLVKNQKFYQKQIDFIDSSYTSDLRHFAACNPKGTLHDNADLGIKFSY